MSRAPLVWVDEVAAAAVARSELPGRPASEVADAERHDVRALVLTAGSVDVLRRWRAEGYEGPAIIVASDADVVEERAALEPVVWARRDADLRSTLTRFGGEATAPLLRLGPVTIDLERRRVTGATTERLTAMEARVLGYLAARRGRPVARDELLAQVWGYQAQNTNTVPVMIGRLRKKIEVDPKKPLWLLTCRGAGYRLAHGPSVSPDPGLVGRAELLQQAAERLARDGELWLLFAPDGAPLHLRPGEALPALVRGDGDLTSLHADGDASLTLNGRPLGTGARVELLKNDRLRLERKGELWELEVIGG